MEPHGVLACSLACSLANAIVRPEAELKRGQTKAPSHKAAAADDSSSSSDPESGDGAASAAGAPAGSDEARFYALVAELVATGMTKTDVVKLLGYTGNPGANLEVVVAGNCKKCTLAASIKLLEAELEE